ncbi:hypothetical protein F4778DRAFT_755950 [Xylariomycetidae sp. FL2044]|nr:hypothetical protein F4778DRAFT_755950 [Xylariomycetidae sp. FL2044]
MALGEEASYWPSSSLLLPRGRKRYRTNVSPIHWQLRSLISAERQGVLYFPTGVNNDHITRLNTATRECETIKVLSFHPRSLVAHDGWICCGGENGEFAIIRDLSQHHHAGADPFAADVRSSQNSLDSPNMAEASISQLQRDMLSIVERINGSNKTWTTTNRKFGVQRVNCITIWRPPKFSIALKPGVYECPVGVLANNDKTVTVVALEDGEALDVMTYPDCVNRAVLSPDGSLLIAICDDPFLYVHARRSIAGRKGTVSYRWLPLPRIRLKSQRNRDTSECRGSFAACFSPSGRYLAVGTQYGTISIFDVAALDDPEIDPLVTYFNSDRSQGEYGAIRDMAFAPGPYDLLAWTEHRGRIGVADARTNFTQRQILALDDHDGFDHISLNDRSTIDPRLLDPQADRLAERRSGSPGSLPSLMSHISSGRPLPNPETSLTSRVNHPFTPEETAILEAVQSDRRRREARDAREQSEHREQQSTRGSAAWRSSVWAERRETLTRILERERTFERNRENRESQRSATTQTSPEQDRERRAPAPRRRSSIMQALTQNVDNLAQARTPGPGNNESSRESSAPWFGGRGLRSGWSDLEALYNMSGGDGGDNSQRETSRIRRAVPVITDVWSDDMIGFRRTYGRRGSREHQQYPDDTAGLTWSEDGQTLYIGAEDGIYEFRVNLNNRKVFPEIALR